MSANEIPALGTLIWISVKPLIRLIIPTGIGFILSRTGLFPAAASKGASQAILNCTLPALLFSKIIPSITQQNAPSIGPIFLIGFVYLGVSLLLGVLVRVLFPTPRNFRWGLIAAATWSNWGDLPTSVVQTICAGAPFSGTADADLAVAYVAIFILVFYITLFPCRGILFISRDYTHPAKPLSDGQEDDPTQARSGAFMRKVGGAIRKRREKRGSDVDGDERGGGLDEATTKPSPKGADSSFAPLHRVSTSRSVNSAAVRQLAGEAYAAAPNQTPEHLSSASSSPHDSNSQPRTRRLSNTNLRQTLVERERLRTIVGSPNGSVIDGDDGTTTAVGTERTEGIELSEMRTSSAVSKGNAWTDGKSAARESFGAEAASEEQTRSTPIRILATIWEFVRSLATPPTISLITALICALVDPLKALFVVVEGYGFHPTAPDGDPPLAIILDTATFVGNASVPLGLLVLGSALARMRIPRPISRLPIASILALAVCKLVILPVFAFFFVKALTNVGLIDKEDRVLQFTAIFFSVVPSATTQVALTQIFAPEDGTGSNTDVLAAYLIAQYVVFIFAGVILTAVTLSSIF